MRPGLPDIGLASILVPEFDFGTVVGLLRGTVQSGTSGRQGTGPDAVQAHRFLQDKPDSGSDRCRPSRPSMPRAFSCRTRDISHASSGPMLHLQGPAYRRDMMRAAAFRFQSPHTVLPKAFPLSVTGSPGPAGHGQASGWTASSLKEFLMILDFSRGVPWPPENKCRSLSGYGMTEFPGIWPARVRLHKFVNEATGINESAPRRREGGHAVFMPQTRLAFMAGKASHVPEPAQDFEHSFLEFDNESMPHGIKFHDDPVRDGCPELANSINDPKFRQFFHYPGIFAKPWKLSEPDVFFNF